MSAGPRITAMVSTYNSAELLEGCLDDLEAQTVADQMEIVVIDSGSQQDEAAVVRRAQERYDNIVYERTQRETLYGAWNRAVARASGDLIVNANTDDRHRNDAFELMMRELDANPGVDLVYGDWLTTRRPHETFLRNTGEPAMTIRYPEYFPPLCLLHYMLSPAPMWRRQVADDIGPFDETLRSSGDLEWNIRFALEKQAKHMNVLLGLFHWSEETTSRSQASLDESPRVFRQYRTRENVLRLLERGGVPVHDADARRVAFRDLATRARAYVPPWQWFGFRSEPIFAEMCDSWARAE